ncbi:uncharacterized protein FFM5_15339 [Fusarium fujikuroi]|nr:uncharacterized protein FFM5_15339 [Fusarium fujikuroi]
MAAMLF